MNKRKKELIFIVFTIFAIIFIYLYKFQFDSFCSGLSQNISQKELDIKKIASCNDSLVCEVLNKKLNKNKLESWDCSKKEVYFLEWDYYKLFFK